MRVDQIPLEAVCLRCERRMGEHSNTALCPDKSGNEFANLEVLDHRLDQQRRHAQDLITQRDRLEHRVEQLERKTPSLQDIGEAIMGLIVSGQQVVDKFDRVANRIEFDQNRAQR